MSDDAKLPDCPTRRQFLGLAASCAAHIALLAHASPTAARSIWQTPQQRRIVAEEPWGRIEQLSDSVWALISTPLQDRRTLANGAIVAGRDRVLVVEAFSSVEGARWLAGWARRLTGKPVHDVLVTHYHADHSGGLSGLAPDTAGPNPRLHASARTIQLVREDDERRSRPADTTRTALLQQGPSVRQTNPPAIDLGGRSVRLLSMSGHTASDLAVVLDDPRIVIAGDLIWNRMFPNYVDTTPSILSRSVTTLAREQASLYVPGHGPIAEPADLQRYTNVLNAVEDAARRAHARGTPAADAARDFRLPDSLGEWTLFSPRYFEVALAAWERELRNE